MTAVARTRLLCAIVALCFAGPVAADPLADLLPPQTRQLEKRSLIGGDMNEKMYYRGDRGRPGAAFSPDGKLLAVGNPYTGLVVWDLASGRNSGSLTGNERGEGVTVAFAPDGKHLLTVNWSGGRRGESYPVTLWDAKKREKVRSLDEDVNDTLFFSAAFTPDGKTVALAGGFNRRGAGNAGVHFWDVGTGDEVRRLDGIVPADPTRRMSGVVQSMAFAPDGRTLALLADGRLTLVELATNKVRTTISVGTAPDQRQEQMNEFPVGAVAFAPDGRTLAVGCADGTVRRFELRSGRELPPLTGHGNGVIALCFTADGKTLQSLGADQKLFVWAADANRDWRPKSIPLDEKALERLWDTLRSDDALDLYGSAQLFGASPGPTVAFLRKHLTPVPEGDSARIEKLVADLGKEYNERKRAVIELRKIGAAALPALRQVAERGEDDMARRLLWEFESLAPPREHFRAVRALEVLERIDSDDARSLLAALAKGAPQAPFTIEAKAALERTTKGSGGLGATAKLEALWENLGGDDSATAFQAARRRPARRGAVPERSPARAGGQRRVRQRPEARRQAARRPGQRGLRDARQGGQGPEVARQARGAGAAQSGRRQPVRRAEAAAGGNASGDRPRHAIRRGAARRPHPGGAGVDRHAGGAQGSRGGGEGGARAVAARGGGGRAEAAGGVTERSCQEPSRLFPLRKGS